MSGIRRLGIVCALLVASTLPSVAQPGPDIAALYVDAGHDALRSDDLDEADVFAQLALEFHDSSDAWYLRALAGAERGHPVAELVEWTDRSLALDNWNRSDAASAVVLLMRLANRTGEFARAIELAGGFARDPAMDTDLLRDYYLEYAGALFVAGDGERLDELLVLARDRFPDEPGLFRFVLAREPFPSRAYRLEIERLSRRTTRSVNELVYEYSLRAPTREEREWAVAWLVANEWGDPAVAIPVASDDPGRAVELYLERDGLGDHATLRELLRLLPEQSDARRLLVDAAAAFTGVSLFDPDRDGFWTERVTIVSGSVTVWERDLDQDGIVELELTLEAGEPVSVVRRDGSHRVELRYEQYPFVGTATLALESGEERYRMRPRSLRLGAVSALGEDGPRFATAFRLAPSVRPVTRRELRAVAVQIDLVDSMDRVVERTYQQGGPMTQVQRDENRDGAWDHLMLTSGGFALSGVRDIDGDGYFEVAEGYRNGSLVALAVDADDDGTPEVFERNVGVPVREWDLNEDGAIDVREFSHWTDAVIREFPLAQQEAR